MEQKEILMREWEKRYDSYIHYRNQFLNFISLMLIVIVSSYTIAFNIDIAYVSKNILMSLPVICVLLGLYTCVVIIKVTNKLSIRMNELQNELGMGSFDTLESLTSAVGSMKYVNVMLFIIFVCILMASIAKII